MRVHAYARARIEKIGGVLFHKMHSAFVITGFMCGTARGTEGEQMKYVVFVPKEAEMILEREVERALIRAVRKAGGMCLKFVSPGWAGAPDRLCLLPGGRMFFAEVKRPGGKPRPLQLKRHSELRKLGFEVYVIDSKEECDEVTRISKVCE